eukprot:759364-Hanusia_phi.AAC.6
MWGCDKVAVARVKDTLVSDLRKGNVHNEVNLEVSLSLNPRLPRGTEGRASLPYVRGVTRRLQCSLRHLASSPCQRSFFCLVQCQLRQEADGVKVAQAASRKVRSPFVTCPNLVGILKHTRIKSHPITGIDMAST